MEAGKSMGSHVRRFVVGGLVIQATIMGYTHAFLGGLSINSFGKTVGRSDVCGNMDVCDKTSQTILLEDNSEIVVKSQPYTPLLMMSSEEQKMAINQMQDGSCQDLQLTVQDIKFKTAMQKDRHKGMAFKATNVNLSSLTPLQCSIMSKLHGRTLFVPFLTDNLRVIDDKRIEIDDNVKLNSELTLGKEEIDKLISEYDAEKKYEAAKIFKFIATTFETRDGEPHIRIRFSDNRIKSELTQVQAHAHPTQNCSDEKNIDNTVCYVKNNNEVFVQLFSGESKQKSIRGLVIENVKFKWSQSRVNLKKPLVQERLEEMITEARSIFLKNNSLRPDIKMATLFFFDFQLDKKSPSLRNPSSFIFNKKVLYEYLKELATVCEFESPEKMSDLSQKYDLNTQIDASNFKSVPEEMVGISVEGGMFLHGSNQYGSDIIEDGVRFFGEIYGIPKGGSIDSGLLVKPTKN